MEASEKTLKLTSAYNRFTTVSSVVFHRPASSIRLHASLCVSESNLQEVLKLASIVLPMQAADASAKSSGAAEMFGATPDLTPHAKKGLRELGHGALAMLQVLAEENQRPTFAADIDFKPLEDLDPRPWVMACAGKGGLTAEFPFTSDTPSLMSAARGKAPGTALLQLGTDFKHPQLGDGVLIRLSLPLNVTAEFVNELNMLEAGGGAGKADQLGGWCEDKNGPVFVSFIPTCLLEQYRLADAIEDNAIRTRWVKALLVESNV
ncbi:MAG TPA: hypothetical protein VNJ04_07105 [Gemmatimonadaceae bacterium]|nr:hypothetical protein [Gemmatimonadaceae bacterium]